MNMNDYILLNEHLHQKIMQHDMKFPDLVLTFNISTKK